MHVPAQGLSPGTGRVRSHLLHRLVCPACGATGTAPAGQAQQARRRETPAPVGIDRNGGDHRHESGTGPAVAPDVAMPVAKTDSLAAVRLGNRRAHHAHRRQPLAQGKEPGKGQDEENRALAQRHRESTPAPGR